MGETIATAGEGRLNPPAAEIFDPAASIGRADVDVWPWLVVPAMLLFLADVALRRLVLFGRVPVGSVRSEGDSSPPAVAFVDDPPPEPEPTGPSSETLGRLLDRRRR